MKYLTTPEMYQVGLLVAKNIHEQLVAQVWEADLHRGPGTIE